ncbi:MAG: FAD-dependent 5-carboxymethylaminomethyl-2-thiouridine(34) oxidoreductase MnmC [Burkholderiaceae bacterium]
MSETSGKGVPSEQSAAHACGLPGVWRGQSAWRVLDIGFDDGAAFADTWARWLADPQSPRLLHYVAVCDACPQLEPLWCLLADIPRLADQRAALRQQWFGFSSGTFRISLYAGRLLLTLCIGPRLAVLRDLRFVADAVYAPASGWDGWNAKALARLAQPGMPLALARNSPPAMKHLAQIGFAPCGSGNTGFHSLCFQPRWTQRRSRDSWRTLASPPATCAVIGAGLAGAAVAASMARRGWAVSVFDAQPAPAAGASGLPVGLLVAQHSLDNNPRSQLSRAGVRLTLQTCRDWLQAGTDWMPTGVLQLDALEDERRDAPANPDDWSWSFPWPDERPAWATGAVATGPRWNAHAAWIRPARLVQALLAHSGAEFRGNTRVQTLCHSPDGWELLNNAGTCIARVAQVVITNANDAARLLCETSVGTAAGILPITGLQAVVGQMSWGGHTAAHTDAFPPHPVNGAGSFLAGVPYGQGLAWFAGSTYEAQDDQAHDAATRHNLERLRQMLPEASKRIATLARHHPVQVWRGQRCVAPDRMPVCGAVQTGARPTLWISAAMGSRGLSHAILCAELIAAQANGEPLPVAPRLARLVRPERLRLSDHF